MEVNKPVIIESLSSPMKQPAKFLLEVPHEGLQALLDECQSDFIGPRRGYSSAYCWKRVLGLGIHILTRRNKGEDKAELLAYSNMLEGNNAFDNVINPVNGIESESHLVGTLFGKGRLKTVIGIATLYALPIDGRCAKFYAYQDRNTKENRWFTIRKSEIDTEMALNGYAPQSDYQEDFRNAFLHFWFNMWEELEFVEEPLLKKMHIGMLNHGNAPFISEYDLS